MFYCFVLFMLFMMQVLNCFTELFLVHLVLTKPPEDLNNISRNAWHNFNSGSYCQTYCFYQIAPFVLILTVSFEVTKLEPDICYWLPSSFHVWAHNYGTTISASPLISCRMNLLMNIKKFIVLGKLAIINCLLLLLLQ